ncbi:3'-5' exonuclease [Plantibacter flavus]|uniref:exonuclease domain-containing protein n=1 Tax=Plantibacter flavus TaxID=150123 RepID=UPI003F14BAC0
MNTAETNPSWTDRLAVFDLETTGIEVETSRVVTAFVGVLRADGSLDQSWSWMADPGIEIPARATEVHGVTTERARLEGRPAAAVVGEIVAVLGSLLDAGVPVVAYNAPYDFSLLHFEAQRHGVPPITDPSPVVDPLILDRRLDKYRKGKRTLEVVAALHGVPLDGAHDAGVDAVAAGRVAQAIGRLYAAELPASVGELHDAQRAWSLEQAADFQSYMRRVRDPEFVAEGDWPIRLGREAAPAPSEVPAGQLPIGI